MFETLVCTAAIGLSGLVTITRPGTLPAAAMAQDKQHKAIVHIVSRNHTLTVKTGQTGLLYSLTGTDGKVMIADATAQKFAELQPQTLPLLTEMSRDARPAASSAAPPQSIRAGCLTSFSFTNANSVSESSATGMLIQKIARQVQYCVR